jgi:hypothetical protein
MSLTYSLSGTTGTVGTDYGTSLPDDLVVTSRIAIKKAVVTLSITASTTLTALQSGSLLDIGVSTTTNRTITLPTAAKGLNYEFYLSVAPSGTYTVTISGAAATLLNGNYTVPGAAAYVAATAFAAKTSLILGATAANGKPGDFARFYCVDGTNWLVEAQSTGAATGWTAP